ncbi:hypothetical protein ACS0TY_033587 [Phlomoides rotata]
MKRQEETRQQELAVKATEFKALQAQVETHWNDEAFNKWFEPKFKGSNYDYKVIELSSKELHSYAASELGKNIYIRIVASELGKTSSLDRRADDGTSLLIRVGITSCCCSITVLLLCSFSYVYFVFVQCKSVDRTNIDSIK